MAILNTWKTCLSYIFYLMTASTITCSGSRFYFYGYRSLFTMSTKMSIKELLYTLSN